MSSGTTQASADLQLVVSKQEYELQMATNCLGPLLFTQLLIPSLQSAALEVDMNVPKGGIIMGIIMADLASPH